MKITQRTWKMKRMHLLKQMQHACNPHHRGQLWAGLEALRAEYLGKTPLFRRCPCCDMWVPIEKARQLAAKPLNLDPELAAILREMSGSAGEVYDPTVSAALGGGEDSTPPAPAPSTTPEPTPAPAPTPAVPAEKQS